MNLVGVLIVCSSAGIQLPLKMEIKKGDCFVKMIFVYGERGGDTVK